MGFCRIIVRRSGSTRFCPQPVLLIGECCPERPYRPSSGGSLNAMTSELVPELCPHCLMSNPAGTHFCGPLRRTTHTACSYRPLPQCLRGRVRLFGQRLHARTEASFYLGIWLLGLPVVAAGVGMTAIALLSRNVENLLEALPALGMFALWGAIVYKTTRNYIRLR